MRIAYSISLKDFRSLQPAFSLRVGRSAAFKTVLIACAMIAFGGVVLLSQGLALSIGGLLIGLGGILAVLAYFYERLSVKRAVTSTAGSGTVFPDGRTELGKSVGGAGRVPVCVTLPKRAICVRA